MEKPVLLRGLKASAEKPIRFVAADKGTAILDGGKEISGWEKLSLFRCHAAISFSPWGQRYLDAIAGKPASLSKISLTPKLYEEVDIRSPKWQEKYPELKQIAQDPDFNVVRNNLLVNCANTFLRKPAATKPENTVEIQVENNAKCEPR